MFLYSWEFLSVDYDIGYQWYIKGEDDKENVKIVSSMDDLRSSI